MRQGKHVSRDEAYPCHLWCFEGGEAHRDRQSEYRCALPGFEERHWVDAEDSPPQYHMGRMRLKVIQPDNQEPNPLYPREEHDDGCPGSWYRSPFVVSLIKYERLLTEGGFSENITLTRCTDRLVLEAMHLLEQERLRCRGYEQQLRSDATDG